MRLIGPKVENEQYEKSKNIVISSALRKFAGLDEEVIISVFLKSLMQNYLFRY